MSFYIIIRGPLACGKSTISKLIAKELSATYNPIDEIIELYKLDDDMEEGYISQKSFIKANEIACIKAKESLEKNIPVIFDGNFYWKSQIEDLIKRLNLPHKIFTLKAPLKTCIQRDAERERSYGTFVAELIHKKTSEFDFGTTIDVTKPLEESTKEIISKIRDI